MLDEQVPNLSRPRLEMNNLSSAEKVLSAKLLADPDFLQMVRLSTAHRNQRFARISKMNKPTLRKIIADFQNDRRKPHQKFRDLQLVFYTKEDIIQFRTAHTVAFTKWKGRLLPQEMAILLSNRAALLGFVATQARTLPPALQVVRAEGNEQEDHCHTTPAICACLKGCNSAFNECDDEMEGLIADRETGGQDIPPSEAGNPSYCRSFYEAGYGFDC